MSEQIPGIIGPFPMLVCVGCEREGKRWWTSISGVRENHYRTEHQSNSSGRDWSSVVTGNSRDRPSVAGGDSRPVSGSDIGVGDDPEPLPEHDDGLLDLEGDFA